MALKLSDLKKMTKSIEIDLYEDQKLSIEYRLGFYTPKHVALLDAMRKEETEEYRILAAGIADAVASWGFTDVKPTAENLEELPIVVLNAIYTQMVEESLPNPKTQS